MSPASRTSVVESILEAHGVRDDGVWDVQPDHVVFDEEAGAFATWVSEIVKLPEAKRYKVILADPGAVAGEIMRGLQQVRESRAASDNAYFYNWALHIGLDFQMPFEATHESMAKLPLHRDQPAHDLAVNLRRAFSGIVAGNVREAGIRLVEEHGPFELRGDRRIIGALDRLLKDFVAQRRMRLSEPSAYVPCYRIAV